MGFHFYFPQNRSGFAELFILKVATGFFLGNKRPLPEQSNASFSHLEMWVHQDFKPNFNSYKKQEYFFLNASD